MKLSIKRLIISIPQALALVIGGIVLSCFSTSLLLNIGGYLLLLFVVCSFIFTSFCVHDTIIIDSLGLHIEKAQRRQSYEWTSIVNIRFKCNVSTVDENVESWTVDGKMIHFDVKQVLRVTLMKETLYINVTKYWFTIPILLVYLYNAKLEKIIDSESYREYIRFCFRLLVILLAEIIIGVWAVS